MEQVYHRLLALPSKNQANNFYRGKPPQAADAGLALRYYTFYRFFVMY